MPGPSLEEVRAEKEQAIVDQDYDKATRLRDVERQLMISKREEEEAQLADSVKPDELKPGERCGDPDCECQKQEWRDEDELTANIEALIEEIEEHERETEAVIDGIIADIGEVETPILSFGLSATGELTIVTRIREDRKVVTRIHASKLGPIQEKLLLATYAQLAPVLEDAVRADIDETIDNAARLAEALDG